MSAIPLSEVRAHRHAIARAIRNNRYERTDNGGLWVPVSGGLAIHGVFEHGVNGQDWRMDPNLVVNQGLNHLLNALTGAFSAITSWYVAPFKGNVTPSATVTASNFTSTTTEATEYVEGTRVAWTYDAVSSQSISNNTTRANFTINAPITVYGAGILSASGKSATTGTLLAYAKFASSRALVADDVLTIKYTLSASSS